MSMVSLTDLDYLQLTLRLAAQGVALVSPNPLVGSIVVKDDRIVGQGFYRYDDLKHAEVLSLEKAGSQAQGAIVYTNLEPCSHQGGSKRTPPCVQALIKARIARIVAAMVDPNPFVNGHGFEQLRAAGIDVSVGICEREARQLNEKYIKYVTTSRPFVHLKIAASLDGRIATRTGDAKWITGEEARAASQALRHEFDAILVGINTVLVDDPLLSDRTEQPRHRPLARIVLDAGLRIPLTSQLVQTARELPLMIFCARIIDNEVSVPCKYRSLSEGDFRMRREALESLGVTIIPINSQGGYLDLAAVLEELGGRQVTSVIVEGGAEVAASFIEARLADKITFFYAPKIIGGREAVPAVGGRGIERLTEALTLHELELVRYGDDWEVTGYPAPQHK